jgi:hypothetical protein
MKMRSSITYPTHCARQLHCRREKSKMPIFNEDVWIGTISQTDNRTTHSIQLFNEHGIIQVEKEGIGTVLLFTPGVSILPPAPPALLEIGNAGLPGSLIVRDGAGRTVFEFNGQSRRLIVRDGAGRTVFEFNGQNALLTIGGEGNAGDIHVRNSAGGSTFLVDGNTGDFMVNQRVGNVERQIMRFHANDARLVVGAEGKPGDIALTGSDCAEVFDIAEEAEEIEPGTVMVIGQEDRLRPSTQAYDKKVAGVISGAGDYRPGILLGTRASKSQSLPLALTGKVYCKADAQYAPIEVGDLLTTSTTPGHAMKAVDPLKAFGAVIGKALRSLSEGQGLISILIALQ